MQFLKRIGYSLRMLRQHRHRLATIYHTSPRQQRLSLVSPLALKQQGVQILVLDFDGVLAAHGELAPVPELGNWLQESIEVFGADQIFILSNKPLPSRIAYFKHHYTGIRCITEVQKKPYPDGLQKIMTLTKQPAENLLLVDDRLLTGALAACIAQVPMLYISRPYVNFAKRPLQELFFMTLRFIERRLV